MKKVLPEDNLYTPIEEPTPHGSNLQPKPLVQDLSAVALTNRGDGYLGYIRDVNLEDGTLEVIRSLLNLSFWYCDSDLGTCEEIGDTE